MLNRNSIEWSTLTGPAGMNGRRVIDAIYTLSENKYRDDNENDQLDFWEIYHQLCHQHSLSTLTYAAIPHLVKFIEGETPIPLINVLLLFSDVKLSYSSRGYPQPEIPSDLKASFEASLEIARDISLDHVQHTNLSFIDFIDGLISLAGLHNLEYIHQTLRQLISEKGAIGLCKICSSETEILSETAPFSVQLIVPHPTHPQNYLGTPFGPLMYVTPRELENTPWDGSILEINALHWLAHFAKRSNQKEFLETLPFLFGRYDCPSCSAELIPWEAVLNANHKNA
ncbi:MAG: hypothetical protein ACPGVT_04115 [Maricaulaceae bacterium]